MIPICGATGMFGGRVLDHLLAKQIPTRALTHSPTKTADLQLRGAEVAIGDLDSPATLVTALPGIERIFLLHPPHRMHPVDHRRVHRDPSQHVSVSRPAN